MYRNIIPISIKHHLIFTKNCFMYVDLAEYQADSIFERLGIYDYINIESEYCSANRYKEEYRLVLVSINKKYLDKFKEAIEYLKVRMKIIGVEDEYKQVCNDTIEVLIKDAISKGYKINF